MADEDKLSAVLSQFARTLATDFPIQGILDHLVKRIVTVLPITAAGVTLISAGMAPQYIAASDEAALRFERLQTDVGEGPCLAAYTTGQAVAVPDLAHDGRFPLFGLAAVATGLAAVFTFPLRHGDTPLGALDLYRDTTGALGAHDMEAAQTLADVATAYLLNARARDEARMTSDRFRHRALHDQLTGLANRVMLQQRLEHAAQRAKRSHCTTGILFVDLDKFKNVNDGYGHHVGDQLLIAVAQRLSRLVRPGDTLARLSGDEFVFLCEDLRGPMDVEILAKRVEDSFAEPFTLPSAQIAVTVSVGMASAGPGAVVSDQLLIGADTAMYQAKRKGGAGHQIVDLREASLAEDRTSFESDLRFAFTDNKLTLAYQPVVRSHDKSLVGAEALLRWTDPVRGVVPASSIISVAEQSGLIAKIGASVLERACQDRGRWLAAGMPLDLAVNVSTRQLMSPNLCASVASVLTSTGMDPGALVLEITENVFIEDVERAATVLSELKDIGIRLALDDFGTGYSSLSYLKRLPIDIVKIDQSFVADLERAGTGRTMVAAMTNLSHALGLVVTAEGVETVRQHEEIRAIGCELAQGFFYGRPVSASEISNLRLHYPMSSHSAEAS